VVDSSASNQEVADLSDDNKGLLTAALVLAIAALLLGLVALVVAFNAKRHGKPVQREISFGRAALEGVQCGASVTSSSTKDAEVKKTKTENV